MVISDERKRHGVRRFRGHGHALARGWLLGMQLMVDISRGVRARINERIGSPEQRDAISRFYTPEVL
jgi:hypothetical protein